ncbi:hypothetical protein [Gemmiger sp. An50]|uniref:hypothetical protein n=1 Tax=Gemmiger sp. An50 TaxID=1965639 RepID=UPI000B369510|nr:hypothetical protein [Gemmiger sp. An50]OUN83759.1 hypothetical protein B5G03_14195 [Gemmiger sp. An50]
MENTVIYENPVAIEEPVITKMCYSIVEVELMNWTQLREWACSESDWRVSLFLACPRRVKRNNYGFKCP